MASWKRRRRDKCVVASQTPIASTLPTDLLLEVVARSLPSILVRFAAACKQLRHDILSPGFIRRVSHQVAAPYILALCSDEEKPFTLVHPATPSVASLCNDHLFPLFSHHIAGLLGEYWVETSRHGLILFCRCHRSINSISQPDSGQCSDLCVYDPMSGTQTFLSCPPLSNSIQSYHNYILLTAADGIDESFLLLVADFDRGGVKVHTATSGGTWKRVTYVRNHHELFWWPVKRHCDTAVLHGGVINLLVSHDKPILRYDLGRRKVGTVKLPSTNCEVDQLQLVTSSDGKLLKLLVIEGFTMSVWLEVPISLAGGSGWSLETVIDMEGKLRSLQPEIPTNDPNKLIVFDYSKKRSGDVVLLQVPNPGSYYENIVTVFDFESKDVHRVECNYSSALLEIDLPSRLQNMKIFS